MEEFSNTGFTLEVMLKMVSLHDMELEKSHALFFQSWPTLNYHEKGGIATKTKVPPPVI